jgi:hypothetical protein
MKLRSALRAVSAASHRLDRERPGQQQAGQLMPYCVTLERRGVSPLKQRLLVRANSKQMASELAAWMAERGHGGVFRVSSVRRTSDRPADEFDDADFWPSRSAG